MQRPLISQSILLMAGAGIHTENIIYAKSPPKGLFAVNSTGASTINSVGISRRKI